jgi:hypothetical protein
MLGRGCAAELADGRLCRATPLRDEPFCFWHAPGHEEEAAEARRLGGLRRRREKTLSGAYDFTGLGSVESIRRIIEIATLDALGLDNSIARARVLIAAAMAATKLLEVGELEARLVALETVLGARHGSDATEPGFEEPAA